MVQTTLVTIQDDAYINMVAPTVQFHLFEPNAERFKELHTKYGSRQNVHLNQYGLADRTGTVSYYSDIVGV